MARRRRALRPDDIRAELRDHLQARLAEAGPNGPTLDEAPAVLRGFIEDERARLGAELETRPTGRIACLRQTLVFDLVLAEMYRLASEAVTEHSGPIPPEADLCVAAVGGYGRCRLAPWSDIDMVFIPAHEEHPSIDSVVRTIMQLLGDTLQAGRHPRVAHSYRPIGDLPLIDHQTATALLESRIVAGNGSLHVHFMHELMRSIEPVEFVFVNVEERRQVWEDRRQSLYMVEPDLKAGPGGLRDFHAAIWVAKVVYKIAEWDVLEVLCQRGLIGHDERVRLLEALEFNLRCRNWLHQARGQKLDTIHVTYQNRLGEVLGYSRDADVAPAEPLMREHYLNARVIAGFGRRLMALAQRERLDYRAGMFVVDWTLSTHHEAIFRQEPARLVEVFELLQRLKLRPSLELLRAVTQAAEALDEEVRRLPGVGARFLEILRSRKDVAGTLRQMLDCGVLEALVPELAPLMLFLPGDPAHEYSVGEHSMKVVEEVQRLRDHPVGPDEEVLSEVLGSLRQTEVMFFAALFHDIGKLTATGDHSISGVPVARRIAERLGLEPSAVATIEFLIREHLTMMHTARLRALSLPETIEEFVGLLPPNEPLDALDMLTVLTYADTRSVGENVMRDTDRRMLMELFTKAAKWLRERPLEDAQDARETAQRRLRREAALRDLDPDVVRRHLNRLPTYYAVNTPPVLVAKHMSYFERAAQGEDPVVEFYHALETRHTEMSVVTTATGALLRNIAAAVTANNLDVYYAHLDVCAATDANPQTAMATSWVDDFGLPLGQVKRDRLRDDLELVLQGHETVEELLARRGKEVPAELVVHHVDVVNTASRQHSVVTFRAADQRGLLYRLTSAMVDEGLDIAVAKVTTWRGAAEDAFYVVSQSERRKLTDGEAGRLAVRLRERLGGAPAEVYGL